ncbi:DUF3786 domain-containing protein [Clostridium magnum]|uniref:DUF3786 domain-containing protein n=1 Tax=Clostridium magnum DSM 2767 TaxID=1121326 RepID=A0A162SS67_9CLOT|nr:DUF3786 domain-containing protein [Clostridium magnum]KZL91800.1 hypothetical protein CLMAG_16060 [Clostridium magnum DSM 2767]SHI25899.1 protein of unknown function [Clostridium magnum DSM 2767]
MEKENNYEICYENMCREFVKYDPDEVARKSGAYYDSEKKQFMLTCFNKEYLISYPEGSIVLKDGKEKDLSMDVNAMFLLKMLMLSYLYRATNSGLTGKRVPLRELEGIGHAYEGFAKLGVDKLAKFFGSKEELFLKAGLKLGGKKVRVGDVGVKINILPNVPMIFGLWTTDDEFPADASILYDCSAVKELHVEDLAGLCSVAADEIIRTAKSIEMNS